MKKDARWIFPDDVICQKSVTMAREWNIPVVFAQILLGRGIIAKDQARQFLKPSIDQLYDPFLLEGTEQSVRRLIKSRQEKETIFIVGDYDVDGICGSALLYRVLTKNGFTVHCHIPDRFTEGYGISETSIKKAHTLDTKLILTVDNGVTANREIHYAAEYGIDVIVIDHHLPGTDLPEAYAIINPRLPDCTYPFKDLAGVGVAFKLLEALYLYQDKNPEILYQYLDIVALGTAADLVPQVDENRTIVSSGLKQMAITDNPGLIALKKVSGVDDSSLTTRQILYQMAPRINAAGRIDRGEIALKLLTTDDHQEAETLALRLDDFNKQRRQMEDRVFDEAILQMQWLFDPQKDSAIILSSKDWHQGVIGIVASRLVEQHHLPTILIAADEEIAKASARSVPGFNIMKAITDCQDVIIAFGGHRYAAGLTLDTDAIDNFKQRFLLIASEIAPPGTLIPQLKIDGTVKLRELDDKLFALIKRMEPFGPQNPQPVLSTTNLAFAGTPYIVGRNHLRLRACQNNICIDCIGFNMGELAHSLVTSRNSLEIAYTFEENTWGGRRKLELHLKALRQK